MVETTQADLLLEASPVNLQDGNPGLACIEAALVRGMHVVTANKAPLVLAFPRLLRWLRPTVCSLALTRRWPAACRRSTSASVTWPWPTSTG